MYISLYVVVNTFIGGRQPQNKLMRLRTFKKSCCEGTHECGARYHQHSLQEDRQAYQTVSTLSDRCPALSLSISVQQRCCCVGEDFCYRCLVVNQITLLQRQTTEQERCHTPDARICVVNTLPQQEVHHLQQAILHLSIDKHAASVQGSHRTEAGSLVYNRRVRSVIQADETWAGTEEYRERLLNRFRKTVFQTRHSASISPEAQKVRGDHAKVKLELIHNAEPKAQRPIRAVCLRETMMAEKLKDFQARGFLRECTGNPQWVARAFLVPNPGNNKWRLVIEYRWLDSQLKGKNFPLPVIEDQLANQHGNFLFTLLDLEDGFHQKHLEEDSKHLTAFCTTFGVFEWNVLPMGVKVGPAAYQEMVQHVTR